MGYEILVALFLAVIVPLTILGFVVFWAMTHQERRVLEDTWRSFADRRGRQYVAAKGEWPNRSSPVVRWDGFELSVEGVEGGARTRLAARVAERLSGIGEFTVQSSRRQPKQRVITGDPFFDQAFTITSERPRRASLRILDDEGVRRALLGFWQRDEIELRFTRGRLTLTWPGREANESRIDEAERALSIAARAL